MLSWLKHQMPAAGTNFIDVIYESIPEGCGGKAQSIGGHLEVGDESGPETDLIQKQEAGSNRTHE